MEAEPSQRSPGIYETVSLQYKYCDYMQATAMGSKREIVEAGLKWQQQPQWRKDHAFHSNFVEQSHPFEVLLNTVKTKKT